MTGILRTGILSNELELNKGKCMVCLESSRITSNHLEKARRASKSLEEAIFFVFFFSRIASNELELIREDSSLYHTSLTTLRIKHGSLLEGHCTRSLMCFWP